MCSFVTPPLEAIVDERYCNTTCSDNVEQVCGSHMYYNVFTTGYRASRVAGDYYLGCYKKENNQDHDTNKVFEKTTTIEYDKYNTPKICSKYCSKMGFEYFGLTNRIFCWCGNIVPHDSFRVSDKKCSKQCSGDANKYCGGTEESAVFRIGWGTF